MTPMRFVVMGIPRPKGSNLMPYARHGFPFRVRNNTDLFSFVGVRPDNSASLREWQSAIGAAATQATSGAVDLASAIAIEALFFLKPPQKMPREREGLPTTTPDVDKLARAIFDALKSIVFHDDAQVIDLLARKRYADTPAQARVEVTVTPIVVSLSLFPPQPSQEPVHGRQHRRRRSTTDVATGVGW